jgi:hypothetical protein
VLVRGLHAPSQLAPVPYDPLCCGFLFFFVFLLLSVDFPHYYGCFFCFYFVFWVIASLADFLQLD